MMLIGLALSISLNLVSVFPANKGPEKSILAISAREELTIVDRLHSLRAAVEKLPEQWKASGLKNLPNGMILTKPMLLEEVESMELLAADRWTILIQNASILDGSAVVDTLQVSEFQKKLDDLRLMQSEMNRRLDQFNAKIKNGILVNLASRFLNKPEVN